MSKKNIKVILITIAVIAVVGVILSFSKQDNTQEAQNNVSVKDFFVEKFNEYNPDKPIDKNSVENYYHHGSVHDDQIIFERNSYEVVVTNTHDNKYKITIDTDEEDNENTYKELYLEFLKVYLPNISEEESVEYWGRMREDSTRLLRVDNFESSLREFNGEIEQLILEGTIE